MHNQALFDTMRSHDGESWTDDKTLALLAACLRPHGDPERVAAIAQAAANAFDPDRLVDLVFRHRVAGFVAEGLEAAGVALSNTAAMRLDEQVRMARLLVIRNAGEEVRVGKALALAGIDALFLKGATLGLLAHGSLTRKTSWDIDILVARNRLDEAGQVLSALGYRLSVFGGLTDPIQIRRYLATNKEAEWHHAARRTVVELHTELSDNRVAIPGIGLDSARTDVTLMPGVTLQTLAPVPLFAYLAFHGTAHLWGRLKWLADVAALLQDVDIEAFHNEAVALGSGRTPGVAIVLAHEVLGLAVPEELLARIRRDRVTRRLVRVSYKAIAAPGEADGSLIRPFGDLFTYVRAQAWLVPGVAHRWGAFRSLFMRPHRPLHLRVPLWAVPLVVGALLPSRIFPRRQAAGKTASRP